MIINNNSFLTKGEELINLKKNNKKDRSYWILNQK